MFDALGRVKRLDCLTDGHATIFEYYPTGLLRSRILIVPLANGKEYRDKTTYRYDTERRLVGTTFQNGSWISCRYGCSGIERYATSAGEELRFGYDERNRLAFRRSADFRESYRYHSDGRLRLVTKVTDKATFRTVYRYDGMKRCIDLASDDPDLLAYDGRATRYVTRYLPDKGWVREEYDRRGVLLAVGRSDGTRDTLPRDEAGQLLDDPPAQTQP